MFETGFDKGQNLLRMTFCGHVTADEAKEGTDQLGALIAEMMHGFRLLTDMRNLETMDTACIPYITSSMDLLNRRGVATVVRVIPDPHKDIGFNILSLFHYRPDVHIVTCQTLEEAMEALTTEGLRPGGE
jgi:anti-anti-sigma regulatory factor